jgi:hypothetical protein
MFRVWALYTDDTQPTDARGFRRRRVAFWDLTVQSGATVFVRRRCINISREVDLSLLRLVYRCISTGLCDNSTPDGSGDC